MEKEVANKSPWRSKLFTVIFESDTPAGKMFMGKGFRVSGLSFDGVHLAQISFFLDD